MLDEINRTNLDQLLCLNLVVELISIGHLHLCGALCSDTQCHNYNQTGIQHTVAILLLLSLVILRGIKNAYKWLMVSNRG